MLIFIVDVEIFTDRRDEIQSRCVEFGLAHRDNVVRISPHIIDHLDLFVMLLWIHEARTSPPFA